MTITLNEYQELAMKTAIFPESAKYSYPALGLAGAVSYTHLRDHET